MNNNHSEPGDNFLVNFSFMTFFFLTTYYCLKQKIIISLCSPDFNKRQNKTNNNYYKKVTLYSQESLHKNNHYERQT